MVAAAKKEATSTMEQEGVKCMLKSVLKTGCRVRGEKKWRHKRSQEVYGKGMKNEL